MQHRVVIRHRGRAWEWFRRDGSKLRSGYFDDGEQVGDWMTYDGSGRVYKVTKMSAKPSA